MSKSLKFSSDNIKSWLEHEVSSIFIPTHKKAQQLLGKMNEAFKNFADASEMLLEKSKKEIDKSNIKTRGRARALNKLARLFLKRIKQVNVPEQVSFDSISNYAQKIQKNFLVTEVDIKNWFPRISPFFILDRRKFLTIYEKSKKTAEILNDFLVKEYVETKTSEETFQLIILVQTLENKLSELKEEKAKIQNERGLIKNKIAESWQKIDYLKNKSAVAKLNHIHLEINKLKRETNSNFWHLQKPFKKLRALVLHGRVSFSEEELGKLEHYLKNPFEALATEEVGCPLLNQILQKITRLMAEEKLKLKSDKAKKAEKTINSILKDSLAPLHQKSSDLLAYKTQLIKSTGIKEVNRDLVILQDKIEKLEVKKTKIEALKKTTEKKCNETMKRIQNSKAEIEQNILNLTGKKVQIVIRT